MLSLAYTLLHNNGKNRVMVTSTGKPITRGDLILALLDALQLPRKVAVCKCAAHTTGTDEVSVGNCRADEAAKEAAVKQSSQLTLINEEQYLDKDILKDMQRKCTQNRETTTGKQDT